MLRLACAALFLDPGLGKTSITLAAIKILKAKGLLGKVLLVAPLRPCYSVWPAEIQKWCDFHGLRYVILHGAKKEKRLNTVADIYIINPEGLDWLLGVVKTATKNGKKRVSVDLKRWRTLRFDTLVIDELSKFKHTNTGRYKALKQVHHTFSRRWGLTGSPAANGLMDLFGQCYILDQGAALGQYITHYRMQYFDRGYDGHSWHLKEGAAEKIYKKVEPLALRMGDELLDMPEKVENIVRVRLPAKAQKIYTEVEKDLISKVCGKTVTAGTAAAASMKCRQIANGAVYLDQEVIPLLQLKSGSKEWAQIHEQKLDALGELIDELQGSPLLVAYEFNHDLDRIKKRFGKNVPYIGSGVPAKKAAKLERDWNNGDLPVLFGQPASMGHGMNLQGAGNHVAWLTPTWNFELYDQFNRRVRRQGNKHKRVYVHHIIAEDTIDEVVMSTLKTKNAGQNALFRALKKYAGAENEGSEPMHEQKIYRRRGAAVLALKKLGVPAAKIGGLIEALPGGGFVLKGKEASVVADPRPTSDQIGAAPTIAGICKGMILEGHNNEEIAAELLKHFGHSHEGKKLRYWPGWHRGDLRRKGLLPPAFDEAHPDHDAVHRIEE